MGKEILLKNSQGLVFFTTEAHLKFGIIRMYDCSTCEISMLCL